MTAAGQIRILLVDDHPIVRAGLAAIVSSQPDMRIAAQTGSGSEAIAIFATHQPDVTLMDLKLPGKSGVETIRELRQRHGRRPGLRGGLPDLPGLTGLSNKPTLPGLGGFPGLGKKK